jgi:putative DNA primase/helicase
VAEDRRGKSDVSPYPPKASPVTREGPGPRAEGTRLGWEEDGTFILPEGYITTKGGDPPKRKLRYHRLFSPLFQGFKPTGNWRGWLEAAEICTDYPFAYISLYASVAAPLLKILEVPSFVVDFSGQTSSGKTSVLRFGASAWGQHPYTVLNWGIRSAQTGSYFSFHNSLPVFLDESKLVRKQVARDVVYHFSQGWQQQWRWNTTMLTSGEFSLAGLYKDAGLHARIISVHGSPFGNDLRAGGEAAERVSQITSKHCGHLGRMVVTYLAQNPSHHKTLRDLYGEHREAFLSVDDDAIYRRQTSYIAAMKLTATLVHSFGVPEPGRDPFSILVDMAHRSSAHADQAFRALHLICLWLEDNRKGFIKERYPANKFTNDEFDRQPLYGMWPKSKDWGRIDILHKVIVVQLRRLGFNPTEILERWADNEWIQRSPHGVYTLRCSFQRKAGARAGGAIYRQCVCISQDVYETALVS